MARVSIANAHNFTQRGIILTVKAQLFGIVVILIGLIYLFVRNPISADTLGRLTVLEETDSHVLIKAGDEIGRLYKEFSFDFDAPQISDWFGETGFNAMTLQSPAVQDAAGAVVLGQNIITNGAYFIDNRISAENGAARFEALGPVDGMTTSKADIVTTRMWFINGDDLWFQARFFLEQGVPYSLVDFEDNNTEGNPGIRIVINDGRFIGLELKAGRKPKLEQTDTEVPFGRWFEITMHVELDDTAGQVRIWQDGALIIDDKMKTMSTLSALYNSFEIGITATDGATVMLLDDVVLSHQPI